jgi:pre-rRNA-processing protein IPI1
MDGSRVGGLCVSKRERKLLHVSSTPAQRPRDRQTDTMTSSNKKKQKRAADFKKQKLRVGKTAAKPANHTNTSFKAKTLVLVSQGVHHDSNVSKQYTHHLSLLSHHSSATRKDSLLFLAANYAASSVPAANLLPKLAPLILDPSDGVRSALLALLQVIRNRDAQVHMHLLLLHIWSAMSHIEPDIRGDSTQFLSWALGAAPGEVLGHGGWQKGLGALSGVLGFADSGPRGTKAAKLVMSHLGVLKEFLEAGIPSAEGEGKEGAVEVVGGLHWGAEILLNRGGMTAYRYLGLFEDGGAEEGAEDPEGRRRWCRMAGKEVVGRLKGGLEGIMKEGGEVGRMAGRVAAVVEEALKVREEEL